MENWCATCICDLLWEQVKCNKWLILHLLRINITMCLAVSDLLYNMAVSVNLSCLIECTRSIGHIGSSSEGPAGYNIFLYHLHFL